ncbi:MAG: ParB/RepB/Spo0J family partition protein [Candidatus Margulisbacteria bacterium]|jgi:ParB family chromosome partitioning protein|nr:ParB/RepB/Spo0J family partition protein [Candidatus Margulisiibacteriota bacterium]
MSINKRGLGRGLEALLSSTVSSAGKDASAIASALGKNDMLKPVSFSGKTIVSVPVSAIVPNPRQPRKGFAPDTLNELAASIKIHGVIQPLLVRKKEHKYELIAGERRLRASQLAGIDSVPVVIRDLSDEQSLEQALIENIQRENLNALEEAESYSLLMLEFSLTQEQVAQKVGKARSSVANALRLNELPKEIKESLRQGEITAGHARAILAAGNVLEQLRLWAKVRKEHLNVRDTEKAAAGGAVKSKNAPGKNPQLSNIEQALSSRLATKVELTGTEQKGTISIKYTSRDDLERLYALLIHNEII